MAQEPLATKGNFLHIYDFHVAAGQTRFDIFRLFRGDKTRQSSDADRQPRETFAEGAVVLARQQSGRHDDGHLPARHRHDKGGAECNFGFAKPDIAAHQAIHGTALAEIVDDIGN